MKSRFTFQLDDEIKEWCETQADKLGISISGLINVALSQYKDQTMVLSQMPTMLQMVQQQMNIQESNKNKQLGCSCHKCGIEVPTGALNHFTAEDGRILCDKCSKGIKPVNERIKAMLIDMENRG